ncbi:homoserine dehydrogenase [Frateuria aurantia]|uniref:Homoserine dehydrogenase n=1 Tax=Frateuria aurantia (strain ATCC 33424 / DSM 6220 / KCTC 2777 / LMG 1558 / NBRC 3245 / NCIMB 13370) TaxID=767434 RepID=H8L1A7_FRAAD|nr:homoserine dehydrogenase [Frateuria aurantia]AFC87515.1 homoserine dehydrogenase [Frateuria aurantia DSM 6220]
MTRFAQTLPDPIIAAKAVPPLPPTGPRSLAVGVIGPGRVGSCLLQQLEAARPRLWHEAGLDLQLPAVVGRQRMWLDCDDPELNHRQDAAQTWRPADLEEFASYLQSRRADAALLVDCSASELVVARYPSWLKAGMHIVTPNKLAVSGPLPRWLEIRRACDSGARLRYEATVGAGLPVIQTLRSLLDTGDQLRSVQGMFSGTLAWLCNRHDGTRPFSVLLREARDLGYTEPDPRDDLSGIDVARKLVILAREAGHPLSLEDVRIESLVPAELAALSCEAFLERLEALDAPMDLALTRARAGGGVLRHVASFDPQEGARVSLQVLPASHPFAHTRLTDNIVQFTTARYGENPLVVQGPGAGPEVTAAGVFGDLLQIAHALPAHA